MSSQDSPEQGSDNKKPAFRSKKVETLRFLRGEISIVNLEIQVEETKINYLKNKDEYKDSVLKMRRQLEPLIEKRNQLEACITWVQSLK